MRAAAVADSHDAAVSHWSWALTRGLEYATVTAVAALFVAALLSGPDAERFATVAYVAAIAAVIVLALKSLLPRNAPRVSGRVVGHTFPAVFTFTLSVAALLLIGAAFVAQPAAEALSVVAFVAAIAAAALVRGGALCALRTSLARGDRLTAATRYAAAAAVAALAAAALLSSQQADSFAWLAYVAAVVAAVTVGASLIAPTSAGDMLRRTYVRGAEVLQLPESAGVFARTTQYAIATAVVALALASLSPEQYAERLSTTAYLALLFGALAAALSWRLGPAGSGPDRLAAPRIERPLRFAAVVAVLVAIGSVFASSALAETAAACACVYAIGVVLLKRAVPASAG